MSIQITKRRIQRLGGSSLIVTLPKTWVRKLGLTPGDEVLVVDEGGHLRIVPSSTANEKNLKTLVVRYNNNMRGIPLSEIVECAFERGYEWLLVYPSRSMLDKVEEGLKELEDNVLVDNVEAYYDHIEVRLKRGSIDASEILKQIRREIASLLSIAATQSEANTEEAIQRLDRLSKILVRIFNRGGILACQHATLDPVAVGELRALLTVLPEAFKAVGRLPASVREAVTMMIGELTLNVLGGIANKSMKRLGDSLARIAEVRSEVELLQDQYPGLSVVATYLSLLALLAHGGLCVSVGEEARNPAVQ